MGCGQVGRAEIARDLACWPGNMPMLTWRVQITAAVTSGRWCLSGTGEQGYRCWQYFPKAMAAGAAAGMPPQFLGLRDVLP